MQNNVGISQGTFSKLSILYAAATSDSKHSTRSKIKNLNKSKLTLFLMKNCNCLDSSDAVGKEADIKYAKEFVVDSDSGWYTTAQNSCKCYLGDCHIIFLA